ncbi:MAG: hypothetical protein KDD12_11210 [Lewinella sp.]|nr:hypothetical protein [Lewinella sp.]
MKFRFFLSALLMAACMVPALAGGTNPTELIARTTVMSEKTMKIQLINLEKVATTLSINSLDGKKTYYEKNIKKHNGFATKFNFGDLEPGKYLLKVEQPDESLTQVILIDENGIRVSDFVR